MSLEAIVLFTAKSKERVLREGGTSAWRLDPKHARRCTFAVCTRNSHADWVEGKEVHRSAFLIGKISNVVPCPPTPENEEAAENRYLIQFSEFARIDIPEIWKADRNPVKYSTLEDLGIDLLALKWELMPEVSPSSELIVQAPPLKTASIQPLTMAEAKKGLALTFNVAPEAIEITIRG